jgi:shikimate 5-dehydrogenase
MKAGDPTPFDPQIFGISVEQVEKVVAAQNGEGGTTVQGDVAACVNNSADGKVFFDTVYGHGLTSFCALGHMSGARVIDGGGMLVSQAALTAAIVCEVAGVQAEFGYDEAFETMAQAAGFDVA